MDRQTQVTSTSRVSSMVLPSQHVKHEEHAVAHQVKQEGDSLLPSSPSNSNSSDLFISTSSSTSTNARHNNNNNTDSTNMKYNSLVDSNKNSSSFSDDVCDSSPRTPVSPEKQETYCSSTTMPGEGSLGDSDGVGGKDLDSPKRACLVCGDVASGFHYGVASCEACKAFFKRTIQGNIEYTCPANNDCEINKRRRKACQACRFQKCLKMGMLKEGVRLDRVRGGRQKYRRNAEYASGGGPPAKKSMLEENKLLIVLKAAEPEQQLASESSSESECKMVGTLSDLVDRELVVTIGWAKQVPGFSELHLSDQMKLLQTTWAEVLSLVLAYRSLPHSGHLHFASNLILDEKQGQDFHADELFSHFLTVVERLDAVQISWEEYLMLKAIVLVNSDVKVENSASVAKLRESLYTSLYEYIQSYKPNNAVQHYSDLLLTLPLLRQVDAGVRKFWINVRREGKVAMHKLFVEMLETPGR